MLDNFPCKCGHSRSDHRGRIEDFIHFLVRDGRLRQCIDRIGYMDEKGNYNSFDDLQKIYDALCSDCTKGFFMNECECRKFQADNLKILGENLRK